VAIEVVAADFVGSLFGQSGKVGLIAVLEPTKRQKQGEKQHKFA
jgi:hypothetical protein